jgi:hypothetical protein
MELLMTDSEPRTILVSVRMHSGELGEAILKECPVCFAVVREERLDQHVWSHSKGQKDDN